MSLTSERGLPTRHTTRPARINAIRTATRTYPRTLIVGFLHDESNKPHASAADGTVSRASAVTTNPNRHTTKPNFMSAVCH